MEQCATHIHSSHALVILEAMWQPESKEEDWVPESLDRVELPPLQTDPFKSAK